MRGGRTFSQEVKEGHDEREGEKEREGRKSRARLRLLTCANGALPLYELRRKKA